MCASPLYYEVRGQGEPLLLVHAGIADAGMWDEQVDAFAPHYQVIRFDAQGFGRSPTAEAPVTRAQDIFDLLGTLHIERTHIVGLSAEGSAALDFAVSHPQMVGALVPVAAGLSGYEDSDPWLEEQDEREEGLMEQGDIDAATELDLRVWLAGPARLLEAMDAALTARLRPMARDALVRQAGRKPTPQIDPPAASRLEQIGAPTLVMVGDSDAATILNIAEVLAARIPHAQKRVFADTAHMVNMERPAEFNHAVLEFLDAHPVR